VNAGRAQADKPGFQAVLLGFDGGIDLRVCLSPEFHTRRFGLLVGLGPLTAEDGPARALGDLVEPRFGASHTETGLLLHPPKDRSVRLVLKLDENI
jgi:hypothetical protein